MRSRDYTRACPDSGCHILGVHSLQQGDLPVFEGLLAHCALSKGGFVKSLTFDHTQTFTNCSRGPLGLPDVRLGGSGGSTSSLGLPSGSAAPAARGLTFATINAETLETAAKDADFPVPSEAIIDKVRNPGDRRNIIYMFEVQKGARVPLCPPALLCTNTPRSSTCLKSILLAAGALHCEQPEHGKSGGEGKRAEGAAAA